MKTASAMQTYVADFLAERRRLGFALRSMGSALGNFARYIDGLEIPGPLTVEVMSAWARAPNNGSENPLTWARRLKILRSFARWMQQFEPDTEVPDDSVFGSVDRRLTPHIYTEQEIADLLVAAGRLQPPLRGATYETLFGLLAATGLRVSEALHLLEADVDLRSALLTVRQTKFAKSRQVPLHVSTVEALTAYRRQRDRQIARSDAMPFFVATRGRRQGGALSLRHVDRVFRYLCDRSGRVNRGAHHAPRIHDLRHTFVVRRMLLWQAQGIDVDQQMLALSTYVGHAMVTNTYWYITAVPALMAPAAERFEPPLPSAEASYV
jgi:integrase